VERGFGGSLESVGRFCVGAFGSRLEVALTLDLVHKEIV
jgi:hypothetical protein